MSESAFRELRLAAGAGTNQLAKDLGISRVSVQQWNRGESRPRWRYLRRLAEIFGIHISEAIQRFWQECVGDPCPCGCGGEKILPDYDEAKHLYIKTSCEKCGKIRIHSQQQGHFKLCRRCSYNSRSLGPPVKVKCGGYRPYGTGDPRFASNCAGETEKKRKTLRYYKGTIDEARGEYQCKGCGGALRLIEDKMEKDVRKHLKGAKKAYRSSVESKKRFHEIAGFPINKPLPKIQSYDQLIKLRKACSKLSYKDDSGAVVVFDRHSFAYNENKRKWGPRQNSIAQATGLLIKRSKQGNVVKGLCGFCGKIVLSNHQGRASKVHQKCYQDHWGERQRKGIPAPTPGRGRPVELEKLRRHYSWAIRYKLGEESYGEIASSESVTRDAVAKGVQFIISRLPDPELVRKQFRDRILRLRQPEGI
jgi:transcriptional regulator with XRE-family HTH domain